MNSGKQGRSGIITLVFIKVDESSEASHGVWGVCPHGGN